MKIDKDKQEVQATEAENKVEVKSVEDLETLIPQWKAKYGRVFKNVIDGEIFIWRIVKRGEYKEMLREDIDPENRIFSKQESITKLAVLYPINIEEIVEERAGIASVLSEEILAKSGFDASITEEL